MTTRMTKAQREDRDPFHLDGVDDYDSPAGGTGDYEDYDGDTHIDCDHAHRPGTDCPLDLSDVLRRRLAEQDVERDRRYLRHLGYRAEDARPAWI